MTHYGQEDVIYGRDILQKAYDKDVAEFGHAHWRVTMAEWFAREIGEELNICWEEA